MQTGVNMGAALIGLDWGTSHLRGYLLDADGLVLERRHSPHGVRALPEGGFNAALSALTQGWPSCPRVACGMVGGRGGWCEVPYLDVPANADALAATLGQVMAHDGAPLWIVPGVRDRQRPDVMRGEETQVVGALAETPVLWAEANVILPGTHCKWVRVHQGQMIDVRTVMTGELFALLLRHSLLASGCDPREAHSDTRFLDGVHTARDSGGAGGWSRLFAARALWVNGQLAAEEIPGWLSGVLIGEEIRSMLADSGTVSARVWQLIGEPALCTRYRQALAAFSIEIAQPDLDSAASGLWQIALRSGLVTAGDDVENVK